MNDAAFGPSGLAAASPDPRTQEGQPLLAALGYNPGQTNGIWVGQTASALTAFWFAIGKTNPSRHMPVSFTEEDLQLLRNAAKRAGVQAQQAQQALQQQSLVDRVPEVPFWKKPGFVGLAVVVVAAGFYLSSRESAAAPVSDVEPPQPKKRARKKPLSDLLDEEHEEREKCSRTPNVDFVEGEVLKVEEKPVEVGAETITVPSV